jgi:hypothetical protein
VCRTRRCMETRTWSRRPDRLVETPGTPSTHARLRGRGDGRARGDGEIGEVAEWSVSSSKRSLPRLVACDFFPFLSLSGRWANRSK